MSVLMLYLLSPVHRTGANGCALYWQHLFRVFS